MKLNKDIGTVTTLTVTQLTAAAIACPPTLLVPYCEHHVSQYHSWMQDEETRTATASELLTLQEEYDNQRSWRQDPEKLTFIICKPPNANKTRPPDSKQKVTAQVDDSPEIMVGDVNLFLGEYTGDSDGSPQDSKAGDATQLIGEINIMVAVKSLRRSGLGRNALQGFLAYTWLHRNQIVRELEESKQVRCELMGYQAKIDSKNTASIGLFKSMGFKESSDGPNFFGEVELLLLPDKDLLRQSDFELREYGFTETEVVK